MNKVLTLALITGCFSGSVALAGHPDLKTEVPKETVETEPWHFTLAVPGWGSWHRGVEGINGSNSLVRLGPNDLLPKVDIAAVVRADAHKGRFGIMAEYSFFDMSDGLAVKGLVNKIDSRTDEHLGEVALAWRVI